MKMELCKLKRTLAPVIALLSPVLPVIMNWGIYRGDRGTDLDWQTFIQNSVAIWSLLLMPFIVTIVSALTVHLEQQNGTWRANLILPRHRSRLFFEKFLVLMILVGVSQFTVMAATLAAGHLLPHKLQGSIPIGSIATKFLKLGHYTKSLNRAIIS